MTSQSASSIGRPAVITVVCALLVMVGALTWGLSHGDLPSEGRELIRMPWGIVSLIEIYVGIALFGCWVFLRETSLLRAVAWMLAVVALGNAVSCIYVLAVLRQCRGDAAKFWLGPHTAHLWQSSSTQ